MSERTSTAPLKAFFGRLVRRTLTELWMGDEHIIDYLSDMLARFARTENLYRIKGMRGMRLESVVEMLVEANRPQDLDLGGRPLARDREIFRHIGDYTLFMTGIFREYVERLAILPYYLTQGRRSYRRVSDFDRALYIPGAQLFEELSDRFEEYAGALNYMRKVYFPLAARRGPYRGVIQEWTSGDGR